MVEDARMIELAEALGEAYSALAAAFARIHGLPRAEDTALANRIGRARAHIERVRPLLSSKEA